MHGFLQGGGLKIRLASLHLGDWRMDQDRFTPGSPPCFHVGPAVTDHETFSEIEAPDRSLLRATFRVWVFGKDSYRPRRDSRL